MVMATDNSKGKIGANTGGSNITYLDGTIDEFSFWDRALTQRELRDMMCTKLSGNENQLRIYYSFDQRGGNKVNDQTGNNFSGTLNGFNAAWQPSSAPIGDFSRYNYFGASAGLNTTFNKYILALPQNADTLGIHIYRVDTAPIPSPNPLFSPQEYYGVFNTDYSSTHRFEIKSAGSRIDSVWRRDHNADTNWSSISAANPVGVRIFPNRSSSEQYVFFTGCPEADLFPANTLVCGESLTLDAQLTGARRYRWSTGENGSSIIVSSWGKCSVEVFLTDSCVARDTIDVLFTEGSDPIGPQSFSLCQEGNRVVLSLDSSLYQSASWSNGDSGWRTSMTSAGLYWVRVLTNEGCQINDTFQIVAGSTLPSTIVFKDQSFCLGEKLVLRSPDSLEVKWPNGSLDSFAVRQSQTVRVEISDSCASKVELFQVERYDCDCPMFMPNAFSPNGDGLNEEFKAVNKCQFLSFRLSIFDRWGKLLFETTDPEEPFTGRHRGEEVPVGLYTYVIRYTIPGGSHRKQGTVMLLR